MLSRWRRVASQISNLGLETRMESVFFDRSFSKVAVAPSSPRVSTPKPSPSKPEVRLNAMFWSKPCSLALAPNSPLRIEEPQFEGIRRIMLKLLLFYSKQSKSIRGANVVYKRIISQIDQPVIYDVFHLEKTFKTTFALLVLHMWLFLRRMKEEGKGGVEFGQYLYEIYNHDLELRVSKAGVNLLLIKWMKELEKIFYGNIIAYDKALSPEAKNDELANVLWRNVFSEDGSALSDPVAATAVQAMARYTRRESTSLSMTGMTKSTVKPTSLAPKPSNKDELNSSSHLASMEGEGGFIEGIDEEQERNEFHAARVSEAEAPDLELFADLPVLL